MDDFCRAPVTIAEVAAEEKHRHRALLYYSYAICPEVSMVLADCSTNAPEFTTRRRLLWRARR